jgi:dihydrofolate reductase
MIRYSTSISLDGFTAGPDQSLENPLGIGGMRLHDWVFELAAWRQEHGQEGGVENASTPVVEAANENVGAILMGRNMFGGGPGPWADEPWNGWWGDEPPFHIPVFVLTHHARPPLECHGGTTFTFATDGLESAVAQARDAAGGQDIAIAGGASIARQCLAAGLLDEIRLSVVPVLLGRGVRPFDDADPSLELEQTSVVDAPGVVHLTYRLSREL